jgi:flagellar protein FliO/FliZ
MRVMDLIDIGRYLGALILVLGLVGAAGLAARRFGLPSLTKPMKTRRLKIVESLMITPRQRLMLISRDGIEHLVVIGPDGASVIEQKIAAPQTEQAP